MLEPMTSVANELKWIEDEGVEVAVKGEGGYGLRSEREGVGKQLTPERTVPEGLGGVVCVVEDGGGGVGTGATIGAGYGIHTVLAIVAKGGGVQ